MHADAVNVRVSDFLGVALRGLDDARCWCWLIAIRR